MMKEEFSCEEKGFGEERAMLGSVAMAVVGVRHTTPTAVSSLLPSDVDVEAEPSVAVARAGDVSQEVEPDYDDDDDDDGTHFFIELPLEIQLEVLSHLCYPDLVNVSAVCRHWHMLAHDRWLWKRMYWRCFQCDPQEWVVAAEAASEANQASSSSSSPSSSTPASSSCISTVERVFCTQYTVLTARQVARQRRAQSVRNNTMGLTHVKLLIMGDAGVGKTSLQMRYCLNIDIAGDRYMPTREPEFFSHTLMLSEVVNRFLLKIVDVPSHHDLNRPPESLDPLFDDVDAVLLSFSLVDPSSYESAMCRWLPGIRRHCGRVPVVLVGLKSDQVMAAINGSDHADAYAPPPPPSSSSSSSSSAQSPSCPPQGMDGSSLSGVAACCSNVGRHGYCGCSDVAGGACGDDGGTVSHSCDSGLGGVPSTFASASARAVRSSSKTSMNIDQPFEDALRMILRL